MKGFKDRIMTGQMCAGDRLGAKLAAIKHINLIRPQAS